MRKRQMKGRRRQKVLGALCLVIGIVLISIAVLQWAGIFPKATVAVGSLLPEPFAGLRIYITPVTCALTGTVLSFGGIAALLALCGCCAICYASGFSNPDYYLNPMRAYRDQVMKRSWYGRIFVWLYYNLASPTFILFVLMIPKRSWKRRVGLWLIPRLSRWCRRRVRNGG